MVKSNIWIDVGIKTDGNPIVEKHNGFHILKNMLIGDNFHWQKTIEVHLPGDIIPFNHSFCSDEKVTGADKNITLINRLPLETYLECVLGSEMNPSAPFEFLKAHAIISRSWALGKILNIHPKDTEGRVNTHNKTIGWEDTEGHKGFHVCSDDHCQRYQGLQSINTNTLKAVSETSGEILTTQHGNIVDARFSKCCGGRTELFSTCWQSLKVDCIESFVDPWCDLSHLPKEDQYAILSSILKDYDLATEGYGFRWEAEISKSEVRNNLQTRFNRDIGEIIRLIPLHRGPSGRIDLLRIQGADGTLDFGKELWIRRLLSLSHLYSSSFEIEDFNSYFRFTGRGWGHGVGLCQIGAANMALHGFSYGEILSFYYPSSEIRSLLDLL